MSDPGSRPTLAASIWAVALVAVLLGASVIVTSPASGRENPRTREAATAGTPVPSAEDTGDPLDGVPDDPVDPGEGEADPLDGLPPIDPDVAEDTDAPARLDLLQIERSGRPEGAPSSVVAYDNDPDTVWETSKEDGEAWLWLDLGQERRVREVRWLATGPGEIEVFVSSDRERWQSAGVAEADRSWQGLTLREDARYVRLELAPNQDDMVPAIAEVAVYGRDRAGVAREQRAEDDDRRRRNRNRGADRDRGERQSEQRAEQDESDGNANERRRGKRKRSGGRVTVSAEQGETSCEGRGNRCRARKGQVSIEEDCQGAGTCTIDVNVDGGTAMCEATGGSRARAGDGEGRRGGNGGRCEAVADGGTVTIGDINP